MPRDGHHGSYYVAVWPIVIASCAELPASLPLAFFATCVRVRACARGNADLAVEVDGSSAWGDVACGILPKREESDPDADGVRTVVFYRMKDNKTEKVWAGGRVLANGRAAVYLAPTLAFGLPLPPSLSPLWACCFDVVLPCDPVALRPMVFPLQWHDFVPGDATC